jgi:hypothetical protein
MKQIGTCEECARWIGNVEYGTCNVQDNSQLLISHDAGRIESDGCGPALWPRLVTGPRFGCIHWVKKAEPDAPH